MRLSLDHLTAVDAGPLDLMDLAARAGCAGVCLFLHALPMLPRMPTFNLVADPVLRRQVRAQCAALGLVVDLVYPFTLTGRSRADQFVPALDAAADLGAKCINVLLYDREPSRRADQFADFCALAGARGLKVAVEFYPASQVATLADACSLVTRARPHVGITVDLLHLVRSGGSLTDLARVPPERVLIGQVCDGPAAMEADRWEAEAACERMLPGAGAFDVPGFLRALPPWSRVTLEVPRESAIRRGLTAQQRVAEAVAAVRTLMSELNDRCNADEIP